MADAAIQCRNLTCGRAGRAILELGDWDPEPGRVHAILGPNGAGKTTLLDTLAGLIQPVEGSVEVRGKPLAQHTPQERAKLISSVPQRESTPEAFTVREIVVMGRASFDNGLWESTEDWMAADRAIQRLDLQNLAGKPIDQVSGGEFQRALIARSFATEAPIFILDEPTSSIDIQHLQRLGELLCEEAKAGRTILVSSHNFEWAAAFADDWLVCNGRAVAHCAGHEQLQQAISGLAETDASLICSKKGRITLSLGYRRP